MDIKIFHPIETMRHSAKNKKKTRRRVFVPFYMVPLRKRRCWQTSSKGSRIESSSEVTRLRITRHGMAKLKSWCKRNTLSLSFFLSLLLLSSLFVRSKLNSPFLWRSSDCSRWYFSPGKLSTDNSRTILERIHRSLHTFEQKETARHFQAFSCFIEQRGRVETIFTESILDAALFKGIFKFFLNFIPSWKLCQLFISFELFCNFSYPKIKILRDDLIILRI